MGADMLIAAVAVRKGEKPNIEAGREYINKLDLTNEDTLTDLVNQCVVDDIFFDDDGLPLIPEIRTELRRIFEGFAESLDSREVNVLDIRGLSVYLTGGMSWGDEPTTAANYFWKVQTIPGLMRAMNFIEGSEWDEDKTVTPEEEAAAIASITKGEGLTEKLEELAKKAEEEAQDWPSAWELVQDSDSHWHTKCPTCGAQDNIYEVDIAVRWNSLTLAQDDGKTATASTGDGDYEHDHYVCGTCLAELVEPDDFEIVDWY